jgi:hypothetical protein
MAAIALRREQVHLWRLEQHHLLDRAAPQQMLQVVTRLGGVHAQLMPSAELSLQARVDKLAPSTLQDALWNQRSLVKTWAMRGTLHLLPAAELPLYVAGRAALPLRRPPSYFTYHGVTHAEYEAILATVPEVLGAAPMTREQLAGAVAQRTRMPDLRAVLLSGWGALLKPSAFRGEICFGPNQGQNVTFVRPRDWIGDWNEVEPHAALQEIARRYLSAFGPAMPEDFARWWGIDAAPARKLFRSLGHELVNVAVEGRQGWAPAGEMERMQGAGAPRCVRLLPQFDAYVVGIARDSEAILPSQHKARVYRPQGWISAVVLVDGRIAGVWEHEQARSKLLVKVRLFEPLAADIEEDLQVEARRLGEFLGSEAELALDMVDG